MAEENPENGLNDDIIDAPQLNEAQEERNELAELNAINDLDNNNNIINNNNPNENINLDDLNYLNPNNIENEEVDDADGHNDAASINNINIENVNNVNNNSNNGNNHNENNSDGIYEQNNHDNVNANSDNSHQNVINNIACARKSRKRKRHYNLNKNKKWNKPYKHQKSHLANAAKVDAENIAQNSRNKHLYGNAKIPKIIFNSKNPLHRGGLSKFFLPDKRPRKDIIIPPTKFLLGGNISDPLNLNSLQDEALASMSAVTPKSSPITTPPKVEVIIPPNIYDPLHLLDPVDSVEYEKQLISPLKQRRLNKQRSRKKRIRRLTSTEPIPSTSFESAGMQNVVTTVVSNVSTEANTSAKSVATSKLCALSDVEPTNRVDDEANISVEEKNKVSRDLQLDLSSGNMQVGRKRKNSEGINGSCCNNSGNLNGSKNKLRRFDSKDKIVSPVIPQPGAWKRPPKLLPMGAPRNRNRTTSTSISEDVTSPTEELNVHKKIEQMECEELRLSPNQQAQIPRGECLSETPVAALPNEECDLTPTLPNSTAHFNSIGKGAGFKPESIKYQYGNYAGRYCGLQNLNNFTDVRLTVFMRHAYLFRDKDILDIGCNVGHMTIAVARKLHPKSIVGIDIDKNLIARARRNLSFFVRIPEPGRGHLNKMKADDTESSDKGIKKHKFQRIRDRQEHEKIEFFPVSFPICYRGIPVVEPKVSSPSSTPVNTKNNSQQDSVPLNKDLRQQENSHNSSIVTDTISSAENPKNNNNLSSSKQNVNTNDDDKGENIPMNLFPDNVFFRTLNYAVTDELQMVADGQQYDLILCLSLTKWIHLNFGDAGLKMTFRRMFNQLRPGGKLILEAQNWASYKKRKKLTETIFNNYKNIEFFPNNFHEYLLSPEVGFSHSYALGVPRHASKGFYRPIQLYIKGDFTPSQVRWSDSYHPQTPYEPYRYAHYADPMRISSQHGSRWGRKSMDATFANVFNNRDTPFSAGINRYNTPSHGISASTSRYYNPLETDSYLPSYDNEVQTRHYCFASPLYATVWSPPASGRKSASQTPLFGSIRRVNDGDDLYNMNRKHVYLTTGAFDGGSGSSRSVDDTNCTSPQTPHHVYAIGSSRSVRDIDLDTNANSPKDHVYAASVAATCCDNSSSPHSGPSDLNATENCSTEISPSHHYSGESSRSVEQDEQNVADE